MTTNILAPVLITLITNVIESPMSVNEARIETRIISERHVVSYTNGVRAYWNTNDYQLSIERRKFIAVRTVTWKEVPMPSFTAPIIPPSPAGMTNNFGSVNQ